MSPITITALVLFAVTYIMMLAFQKIRPYITVGSALIFVALGVVASVSPNLFGEGFFELADGSFSYGIGAALGEIDWNVIMMIAGTMGTVYLFIYRIQNASAYVRYPHFKNAKCYVDRCCSFALCGYCFRFC